MTEVDPDVTSGYPQPPPYAPPPFESEMPPVERPDDGPPDGQHSRAFRAIAGTGIAVLVAGGVAAAVLAFGVLRGTADSMVSFAPSNTAVYANLDLTPSAGQQLALNSILGKFPGLAGSSRDSTINHWLDSALQSSGLSHTDVRSWLGSQLSLLVLPDADSTTPAEVSLIASTDDSAAQAMFTKYKAGPDGTTLRWTTPLYDGVNLYVGQDSSGGAQVWAITAHTVIFGTSESAVDEVIDTSQGKHAGLTSTDDYVKVQSQLPSDRFAVLYLDVPSLRSLIPSTLATATVSSELQGYQGIGEAVVATSSGISSTGTVDFDASKLSGATRTTLHISAHANGAIPYVPENAFGFVTLVGLPQMLQSLVSLAVPGAVGSEAQALQQLGITGSSGIISHLTGDAGIEVEQIAGAQVPSGALLVGTDSSSAAQGFLDTLARTVCSVPQACGSSSLTSQTYEGVSISSLTISNVDSAQLSPSWAVDDGWAIIASTPGEVRAVIDAKSGDNITKSAQYQVVAGTVGTSNNGMFYLNVHAVVAAVRAILPASAQATFDEQVAPYLSPVQAIGSSSHAFSDHISTSELVLIH